CVVAEELVDLAEDGHNQVVVDLGDAHLWQGLKDPYLYTASAELLEGENILDSRSARFGCRTFSIDPDKGFFLNDETYPLRGVAKHQDRPVKGNAVSKEDQKEDLELIREMGANTIRLAHYQHDQVVYDLCDEMGFVLWAEIPYISVHMPDGRANTLSQMEELIAQNYNHPSIFVWGLSNEITMKGADDPDLLENHRLLNDLAHKMDPTRLTTMAVVSRCPLDESSDAYLHIPDVHSWNHYFGWYGGTPESTGPWFDDFHKKYPDLPVGLSEYGCEAFKWHTAKPQPGDYSEEYQAVYHESLIRQIDERPYLWATHVWNMFDFAADSREEGGENGMNHKGLVTFDRKYKKDSYFAYKAWLSKEPFVHICSRNYIDRIEQETLIKVYTNQPEVELFVNGSSVGCKKGKWFFEFMIPNVGEQTIKAVAGNMSEEIFIRKVEEPNMDYVMQLPGSVVLNWFDIDEPEGYFSINDTIGSMMHVPEVAELVKKIIAGIMGAGKKQDGEKKSTNVADQVDPKERMGIMLGFTLKRVLLMAKGMTREQIIDLNKKLNTIRK
ncbi:MAG: glycoside hydrolase family 2 protein, partial [Lachnospiraceae bacterium]|nr:glycoside hydrolase family 2 protein [Lachnospiraceae bacterium]